MEQHFTLTRVMIGTDDEPISSTSFTASDADAVNCAHMLAAGFNTMNRNMLGDFVLAVVDKKAGVVQYDGKAEMINRLEPSGPFAGGSFNFEATVPLDPSAVRLFFGDETYSFTTLGKVAFVEDTDETTSAVAAETVASTMSRKVLEDAYVELHRVKDVLFEAGVETIPADAGVRDLLAVKPELRVTQRNYRHLADQNETARAEMISFVKRAHAKKVKLQTAVPDGDGRPELDDRWRGMLDVLAKFLVVTGEADSDEGHAVARKLCGVDADEF